MKRIAEYLRKLSPDNTVTLWLVVWFVVNLFQISFSELIDDEAYYHLYAMSLEWGYFDHPPLISLLIWMGEAIFGATELGLRFFIIVLQPIYLWVFWRLIKPSGATNKDAVLYLLISSAIIMLQPYGFVAVPDAPLLFGTALFLAAYKSFLDNRSLGWLWLGISMAVMAYSKYQGALVVLFAVALNPRLLLNYRFYLSGIAALALFIPHMLWQYSHDFPSFVYHLSGRNKPFEWYNVSEYILNLVAVFSPFFVVLWVQAYRKVKARNQFERALKWTPILFFVFFLFSSLRGATQPQWLIVAVYGLVWILFYYLRDHRRSRIYAMRMAVLTLILISAFRLEIIFNVFGISQRFKAYGNEQKFRAIEKIADGRPVIFRGYYATPSKYLFYTDGEAYCAPSLGYRTHQWQYVDDSKLLNREVIVQYSPSAKEMAENPSKFHRDTLPDGSVFGYVVEGNYIPLKKVKITPITPLPASVQAGQDVELKLSIENPYSFDITSCERIGFIMQFRALGYARVCEIEHGVEIPKHSSVEYRGQFVVPADMPKGVYQVGFAMNLKGQDSWFSAKPTLVEVK